MEKLKNVKGSKDYGGKEQLLRSYISDTLRDTFEKYGYEPLETTELCYYDLLSLKYEDNNEILKEIYNVKDQANRKLALRYDLTVPFAKYIALNQNIKLPYKRYEIGKVFRDGPVKKGRVREFIQCDVDCVGIDGQMVEAEMISIFADGYKELGIDVVIKYNNRKIMSGMIEISGIAKESISNTITIIDKLEKISKEEAKQEFLNIGLKEKQIRILMELLNMNLDEITIKFKDTTNKNLAEGLQEINELNKYIKELKLEEKVEFVSTLARGQEYYTGVVFEVYTKNKIIPSSIGGGGRYDNMIGDFIDDGKKYPAVGISFGLDTIFEILKNRELPKVKKNIYIIPMNNNIYAMKIAKKLRKNDVNVEIEMNNKKLRKSLNYANSKKFSWVIIIGEEELQENKITLKNMQSGEQLKVEIDKIEKYI